MTENNIPVEYNELPPTPIKVTRLGKAVAAVALIGALTPVALSEGNPVGNVVQKGIDTSIAVVDLIPGVNTPEQPTTDKPE